MCGQHGGDDGQSSKKLIARVVLPENVRPVHYDIDVVPDLEKFTFAGHCTITLDVKQATDNIQLNAAELTWKSVKVIQGDATHEIDVASIVSSYNQKDEVATISLPSSLSVGEATLVTTFDGILNDQMKGFYRSKYTDKETGETRFAGTTQFEATDARRAFPCWDEPAAKATFTVSITAPKDLTVLSNMDETSNQALDDGTKKVSFSKSPIMSTYLLAWFVGELEHIEARTKRGVLVRVFTPLGKLSKGEFALDVAVRCLDFYESYFEIDYPLPKSDLLAIPDFAAGAMENWGLVTYRETALLCDESSSASARQWVALVVAHELAHQWFGNLVTMEWWAQLWLNEGFACWIEYLAVDVLFPEWHIWGTFMSNEYSRALSLDAMTTSHPIEVDVFHHSGVDEIFDVISYSKGASVIRMLQNYLGAETFRKALVNYLNHFSYSNAVTTDLWRFLGEESGVDVVRLMADWTAKQGYPVISAELNDAGDKLTIEQHRFLNSGVPTPEQDNVWSVPVTVSTGPGEPVIQHLLQSRSGTIDIPADAQVVKLNADCTGVFRVSYSPALLAKVKTGIVSGILSTIDRQGLISDASALAEAGVVSATAVVDLLEAFDGEQEYAVWSSCVSALSSLGHIVHHTAAETEFKAFARRLLAQIGAVIGWDARETDDHSSVLLRSLVIGALGKYGDEDVSREAQRRFDAFLADQETPLLPANMRSAVYSIVLRGGGEAEWSSLKQLYNTTDSAEEKERVLRTLGATSNAELLQKTLEWSLSPEVRSQDTPFVLGRVAANPAGISLAWEFITSRWTEIHDRYDGGFLLSRVIKCASSFVDASRADEVESFFEANPVPSSLRAISQTVEAIRTSAMWLARDREALESWAKAQ